MQRKTVVVLSVLAAVCVLCGIVFKIFIARPENGNEPDLSDSPVIVESLTVPDIDSGGIKLDFRAVGDYFYRDTGDEWRFVYLKGVNIGLTEATTDLNSPDVSYDTYREWLNMIAEMNANTVRVFTVMPPQFYAALYDHNASAESPLYLIQGIWFNENYMYECDDAFSDNGKITEAFIRAARETADIVHGNSDYTDYGEIKNAVYSHDVSQYLAGYILGLEWEPGFVERTNGLPGHAGYKGEYLETSENAAPFECFLCEVGDSLAAYETESYSSQTPIAFLNWATTDVLTHTNEPFPEEDAVSVNTENIRPTAKYHCGLFAAVDAYPYYPEFMNYQPEYLKENEDGRQDSYKAYLADLKKEYGVPVIIAEFGVPTSRGTAHSAANGMDQGGITEKQQGEAIVSMMKSIAEEEYAGSLIFSWQDEWFKQTWNTVKYSPDNAAERTPNRQSAEQSYGLLAMEPGKESVFAADGSDSEWSDIKPAASSAAGSVYAMWDEGYLYLKIESDNSSGGGPLLVPVQITGRGSDFSSEYGVSFSEPADFLLVLDGRDNTRLLTDVYQDTFYYTYCAEKGVFERDNRFEKQDSGLFGEIRQFISNEIILPLTGERIAPRYTESGLLTYGVTDAESGDYNSLADFYSAGGLTEIRIPWHLLNVMNSTNGTCLADFYKNGVDFENFSSVKVGICRPGDKNVQLNSIGYTTKEKSSFHTRLKQSYYMVRDAMKDFMEF